MNTLDGVYFRREDYAGFWLRLLAEIIDVVVCGAICFALSIALSAALPPSTRMVDLVLSTSAVAAFGYFVVLKRSKIGTVGYLVCGIRVVGLDGRPATLRALTFRTLFAVLSPLSGFDS